MRRLAGLAAAVALASSAQAQPAGIDAVFAAYEPDMPGCAVGVREKDKAPVFKAYGSADLEHAIPITPDTIFEAGSVSKQFTAAAILLLVEDGKIALTDDIRKYLPEMPDYGKPITVDMLLSHTSGLRDWGVVAQAGGWPRTSRVYTPVEVLQIAARQKALNYTPGEAYSYTNTGYNLAAWIVLRVSGQSLAQFTRARIFEPLGMSHTSWRDNFRRVVPGRAIAYGPAPGGYGQDMPFEDTYGHGGLLTTVGDLLIWNQALTDGKLGGQVSRRMREQAVLTDGRKIAYARGLTVQSANGQEEVAHSGSTAGYRAWLARYPAEGLSVALLCNWAGANPVLLGRRVAGQYLKAEAPQTRPPFAAAKQDLPALAGLYVDERTGGVLRVTAENGGLRAAGDDLTAAGQAGLFWAGKRRDVELAFAGDRLQRTIDGELVNYRRVQPVTPAAADLADLAGAYASAEADATLLATIKGGALVLTPADRPSAPMLARPLYKDGFQVDGGILRVVRGPDGKPQALRLTVQRVYSLDFRRTP